MRISERDIEDQGHRLVATMGEEWGQEPGQYHFYKAQGTYTLVCSSVNGGFLTPIVGTPMSGKEMYKCCYFARMAIAQVHRNDSGDV